MAAIVTCDKLGDALIAWLNNATDEEKAALCMALACAVSGGDLEIDPATAPATSEASELSTVVYGGRDATMGKPVGWTNIGGLRVPHYGVEPA